MNIFQILQKISLVPSYLWDKMWASVWKRCMKHCGKGVYIRPMSSDFKGLWNLSVGDGTSIPKGSTIYCTDAACTIGKKDVLGMWVGENESAKFWATVLNGLRNRGVEDIFIACTDNLTGFAAAIEAVFPKAEIQNCIIHQLRNSSKYVSYKDLKALMADLKAVYAAVDEPTALDGTRNTPKFLSPGGTIGRISAPISSIPRRFAV